MGKSSLDPNKYAAWAKDTRDCEEIYQVDREHGLSDAQVEQRQQKFGPNEFQNRQRRTVIRLILDQFNDTLVRILLAVAVIIFVVAWFNGEEGKMMEIIAFVEPLVTSLILIVNAIFGFWEESNAEKALEALKQIQSEKATVIRNGRKFSNLLAKELVPGDIVELWVGDKIPADMRLMNRISSTLRVEQSSLTGDSEAVSKSTKSVPEESDIQGKKCMVFAGTTVVNGHCICIVTHTGMNTEIGKVHSQIYKRKQIEEESPSKKKLDKFGEVMTMLIGVICLLIWLTNVKYFISWEYVNGWPTNFKFSFKQCTYYFGIAIAVAITAIPEGLPAVITTCLAFGTHMMDRKNALLRILPCTYYFEMAVALVGAVVPNGLPALVTTFLARGTEKMAQKNIIVRKLHSVEALGCATVICTGKTGTLTTNQMVVAKLVAMGHGANAVRSFNVEGTTYNPSDGKIQDWPIWRMDANLQTIAKIATLANDAGIKQSEKGYVAIGMPTEAALKVLVEKMGLPARLGSWSSAGYNDLMVCSHEWSKNERRIATLEFDRVRKSMGVIVSSNSGRNTLLVKGAVENLLERSSYIQLLDGSVVSLDKSAKFVILDSLNQLSKSALRVLGFAYKEDPPEFTTYNGEDDHPAHNLILDPTNYSSIESNLIFAGLAGLRDPPRKEVHQAIKDCRAAGIQVIVITGDNKNTAEAICREIGIFGQHEDISSRSLTGREFMDHPDQKGHLTYKGGLLFSRVEPCHKQEIVRLLKDAGEVVAMTGDGVNDVPALKLVDIGIAKGIAGTEVAKEASDMVLADDNFSTIVAAVGEGRSIYNNMKASICYMISSNIGVFASIFLTDAIGIPGGLIPVQLLLVNPVTIRLLAKALAFNPQDKYTMKKAPRSDTSFFGAWILFRYLLLGFYIGIATVGVLIIWYTNDSFLGISLSEDGHSLVTYSQLTNWGECRSWDNFTVSPFTAGNLVFTFDSNPCDYFQTGTVKAMTLSVSVLVAVETFNSLSAVSEDESLLTVPVWVNPQLLLAVSLCCGLHYLVLYVPFLTQVFGIIPLSFNEGLFVIVVALPIILIHEIIKFMGRLSNKVLTQKQSKDESSSE